MRTTDRATYDAVYLPARPERRGDKETEGRMPASSLPKFTERGQAIDTTGEGVDLLIAELPEGASLNLDGRDWADGANTRTRLSETFIEAVGSRHWRRPAL